MNHNPTSPHPVNRLQLEVQDLNRRDVTVAGTCLCGHSCGVHWCSADDE